MACASCSLIAVWALADTAEAANKPAQNRATRVRFIESLRWLQLPPRTKVLHWRAPGIEEQNTAESLLTWINQRPLRVKTGDALLEHLSETFLLNPQDRHPRVNKYMS